MDLKSTLNQNKAHLLPISEWISESPRACGPNSSRHGSVKPLRQLVLMKSHRQSLPVQELFLSQQFPLWAIYSLASGSNIFSILLWHASKSITHCRKTSSKQNPLILSGNFHGKRKKVRKFSRKMLSCWRNMTLSAKMQSSMSKLNFLLTFYLRKRGERERD